MRAIFTGDGNIRHEDRRLVAEPLRRIGDRRAMIAARRRRDAGRRNAAREQVVECAARLERAGVLEEFELQRERMVERHAESLASTRITAFAAHAA